MIESGLINEDLLRKIEVEIPESKRVKRSLLTDNGADDLLDFFTRFISSYSSQVHEVRTGERDPDEFEVHILVNIGFPNSGKTRFGRILKRLFTKIPNLDLAISYEELLSRYHPLKQLDWEIAGEDRARKAGKIITPADKPFTPEELQESNNHFGLSILEAIEDQSTQAMIVETPGNTAININGELVGRNLGSGVLIDLAQGKGMFEHLNQPLTRKYVVWAAGYRAGPWVRFVMLHARDLFRKAAEKNDLLKGMQIATSFNINPFPETRGGLYQLGQGASIEQMILIDSLAEDMVIQAMRQGMKLRDPGINSYHSLIDPRLYSFATMGIVNSLVQRSMPSLVENFLLDKNHLALPESRTLIGDNNPDADELGFTEDHLQRIYSLINP